MIDKELAQDLLNILGDSGIAFGEVFVENTKSNMVFMEGAKIEKITSGIDQGVGMRLVDQDQTYYAYSNAVDRQSLTAVAKELASVYKSTQGRSPVNLNRELRYPAEHIEIWPGTIELGLKVDLLVSMDRVARQQSPLVKQVALRYADVEQEIVIANTQGLWVQDKRARTRYMVNVIAEHNGLIQTGYEGPGQAKGLEFIQSTEAQGTARKAAQRAIKMLEAQPAPAGKMTVVLGGEAGGTMIHEACGHSLEADFIYKNTSIFSGKIGMQVASPLITVLDDGSLGHEYGYAVCDDEGVPTARTVLIENGILKAFMTDRVSAGLLGLPLSGNGRRESYRSKPVPRMTNTYIAQGNTDPAEILSSVKTGLYVARMGGGQVNTTNGDFVFEVSEGYLIENGKLGPMVRGATLTGNGPQILSSVSQVGNDLSFMPGVCGKGDHVPVSDGQPTLLIPEIIVGGHV